MKHTPTGHGLIVTIELAAMVDRLAELKALIAPLQSEEEKIKDYLKAANVPADKEGTKRIDGTKHTAVIVPSVKNVPATDLLKEHFGEQVFLDQWCYKSSSVACRLTARKTH
jgi:hypothetical protein